jgi:3-dehydroquinate synthase
MKILKLHIKAQDASSYDIRIGNDVLGSLGRDIAGLGLGRRYVAITDTNVSPLYGGMLIAELKKAGIEIDVIAFPAGEASKNINTVLSVVRQLLRLNVDRQSALIALGGGVVGDMVGFIASLYMRSVPYVQIPTTLLAQVDSSIGGKTAIDLEEGKNLLGTFYQPRAVFIDPFFLKTLPGEELGNGLAEIVKYGVIDKSGLFQHLEKEISAIGEGRPDALVKVIEMSCAIKKELVEMDEKDKGPRRFLNFGHTVGHALESASGYGFSHGSGVSVGMIAAARLSEKICGLPASQRGQVEKLIGDAGLPTAIPGHLGTDLIMSKLKADKKKSGSAINFVLIKNIGEPFVVSDIEQAIIRKTIEELKK